VNGDGEHSSVPSRCHPRRMFCLPYLPPSNSRQCAGTLLSRCESCGSTFGHLTVVPAGQGGVRSAGEILSAIVNQTRHKNLSASMSSGPIPVAPAVA
jgi:hypothetical protein